MKRFFVVFTFVSALVLAGCQQSMNTPNSGTWSVSRFGQEPTVSKDIASPFFGSSSSPVQMTIFTDFQCPACIAFHAATSAKIFSQYVDTGRIGLTIKNYPLPGHKNAARDALAALCAASQNKYRTYGDDLYAMESEKSGMPTTDDDRITLAKKDGLDTVVFSQCLSEGHYIHTIEQEIADGDAHHLEGTPSIYLNGVAMKFTSWDDFFQMVDAYIVQTSKTSAVASGSTTLSGATSH